MRAVIFQAISSIRQKYTGPFMRTFGKNLYALGTKISGIQASQDRIIPSLRKLTYSNYQPDLQQTLFVAPNATILGNVVIGAKSSVWYSSVLNGVSRIRIGNNCVIQDRAHLSRQVTIGDNVFVGPNSIIQGSTLNNRSFIAMGATVRHATVQQGGFVAAGAVIPDNAVVKQGQIWAGNPGRFLRNITPVQRQILRQHLEQMQDLAAIHQQQTEKTFYDLITGYRGEPQQFSWDHFLTDIQTYPYVYNQIDEQFIQRRIFLHEKMTYPDLGKDYQPYEYDYTHMGDKFNVGIHNQQLHKTATKLKQKQAFQQNKKAWKSPF